MKEIETKIININVDEIRSKLLSINAKKVKQENQINKIFDFADKTLLNKKGYARIRIVEDLLNNKNVFYMTIKQMLNQSKYKVMNEYEVKIDNPEEGEKIFNALGLELVQTINKYRESYKYKNTLIEIDINEKSFFPFPYIEIESIYEKELEEVVNLLGYTLKDTNPNTIHDILKQIKENH